MSHINSIDHTNPDALDMASAPAPYNAIPAHPFSDVLASAVANRVAPESGGAIDPILALQQRRKEEDNLHEQALKLRLFRQQLIASNIANADTPG